MKIFVCTNVARSYNLLTQECKRLAAEAPELAAGCFSANGQTDFSGEIKNAVSEAEFSLFLWMGSGLDNPFLQRAVRFLRQRGSRYLILVENAGDDQVMAGVSDAQAMTAWQYFRYDGAENHYNLLLWLGSEFGGTPYKAAPPTPLPWNGVWHPDWEGSPEDIGGYLSAHYDAAKPTAGVIFYRSEWISGEFAYHTSLVRALEDEGMNVIAVFTNTFRNESLQSPSFMDAVDRYFYRDGKRLVDVLVTTTKFSLHLSGTATEDLSRVGVPILTAYTILGSEESWAESPAGLEPSAVSISVSLPEFDGTIHSVPIAAKTWKEDDVASFVPLPERVHRVASKARKWAALSRKKNDEKRIAIVLHNYPPTNSNIGSAAGLDTPESVRRMLAAMKEAGYQVDFVPESGQELIDILTAHVTNDREMLSEEQAEAAAGRLTAEEYRSFFKKLPAETRERMTADWGEAPGEVFLYDEDLLIPGTMNGNVFLTVQPPRGFGEDPGKILHSPDLAPPHHYIGFYHWVRDLWHADAVIHVGTHGSLEWLPGKSTGLSEGCYPDIALGDLPDIYPYWITIVGEGLQAKRRGAACLVSHLSPPMRLSGVYAEMAELESAMDEYAHFRTNQPDSLDEAKNIVREKAAACHFDHIAEKEDFDAYVGELHNAVTDIKNMQIRTGLHILGQMPTGEDFTEFLMALLRLDNGDRESLIRLIMAEKGLDYERALEESAALAPDGESYGKKLDAAEQVMHDMIAKMGERGYSEASVKDALSLPELANISEDGRVRMEQILRTVSETLAPKLRRTEEELSNTLRALEGQYIEPSQAGAPTTNGDALLPTGRNFYGLDPRTMPTQAAWAMGKTLGDETIKRFIADEGHYPESVGVVFWSGANMRSHGQCVAEYLYLMGVRPVWQRPSMRVVGLEIIPLSELGRPRIDVTGRISGLFRDSMPDAIRWMDEAVRMVRELDEPEEENFVRKHVLADAAWLEENGASHEEAWARASYRIFGDPPGAYGAGVQAILATHEWQKLSDIADVYVRYSGTAYGSDALPGAYEPEVFKRRMRGIEATIKNEDNREVHMFSCDDFNAYHGGMIATVRALTGKAPKSYSTDTSDRRRVQVRSVREEAKRIFRGEIMNPKFIDGMKRHGYKGASELANVVAHSYEWDATSNIMDDWMYEEYAKRYALDPEMRAWMNHVNPWALRRIAETLLEAQKRGLWNASQEMQESLVKLYLEVEGEMEERADA